MDRNLNPLDGKVCCLIQSCIMMSPKGQIHTDMDQVLQYHHEPWGQCRAVYRADQKNTAKKNTYNFLSHCVRSLYNW